MGIRPFQKGGYKFYGKWLPLAISRVFEKKERKVSSERKGSSCYIVFARINEVIIERDLYIEEFMMSNKQICVGIEKL